MSSTNVSVRVRALLSTGAGRYGEMMVALSLNVPFLVAALSRYPDGLNWASLSGLYAGLVFVGYYVSILLFILTCLFLIVGGWRRVFLATSAATIGLTLYYFLVDGMVYRVLKAHIDAFWLQYLLTTFEGLGIRAGHILVAVILLLVIVTLEWLVFRMAGAIRRKKLWVIGLTSACLLALVVSQAVHVAAYEANDTRITALTPELPFYYPLMSHKNALKYGAHLSLINELEDRGEVNARESLRYPLRDLVCRPAANHKRSNVLILLLESWRADAMDSVITPRMYTFSKHASVFTRHFSSGNSTPAGVFPLFYGIHSTYWTAVKANNAHIHNPVLIDALQANGYAFGIFAQSHFERHKIKDAVFRGIEVQEPFKGSTVADRDRDMTDRLLAFMEAQKRAGRPFFGFAFYKSSHYPYDHPAGAEVFRPAEELSFFRAAGRDDPAPVLNDYRNSVRYLDELIGGLLDNMRTAGLQDSTIIIITGDHGEEFNDNGNNSWGHTGNFTGYQTRVPLIVYIPGKPPRRIDTVTSQVDLAPTMLQEGLGCGWNTADYSNGLNLFGSLPDRRPIIISSYVTHALVLGEDVFVAWPLYVQGYRLDDVRARAGSPSPDLLKQAVQEMAVFYGEAYKGRGAPADLSTVSAPEPRHPRPRGLHGDLRVIRP